MENKRPIGIFDSGVGGLTVLKEIEKLLPKENLIYFGDNNRAPYGSRTTEEILQFSYEIGMFLKEKGIKLLIIACNTATAVALEDLNKKLGIPVIGVIEPGASEAIKYCKNNKIGVFSTPLTAKIDAYKNEVKKINNNIDVYQIGCKPLCKMIESEWEDTKENQEIIKYYVDMLDKEVEVVIFGCTHYPIIKEYFMRELKGKKLINPAMETALKVKKVLGEKGLLNQNLDKIKNKELDKTVSFYTSGEIDRFKKLAESILERKVGKINNILI